MPIRSWGICRIDGKCFDRTERRIQEPETKANCIMVRVAGLGKAVKIVFDEVLVIAEETYQTTHMI